MQRTNHFAFSLVLLLSIAAALNAEDATPDAQFFDEVVPILQRRCIGCHNDQDSKGDLSLQTAESSEANGYIVPGDPEASRLYEVLLSVDGTAEMPKNADPLTQKELDVFRAWIQHGAKWPTDAALSESVVQDFDWWSLKPLVRPPVPTVDGITLTPIDAFVQAKRKELGLTGSPEADRATLIRRLSFDLLGLPPEPGEVEAFVRDDREDAYERLVDRLLASKHYGERWARHWLDVVHYADTHGYDKDKLRPNAWPYRDYVIRSFNADKPYARFIREQIAGDVLWPYTEDGIVATGFIAAGPWDFIGHAEVPETKIDGRIARNLDRDDMVTSTMNTFTSTTVQCARCHNHKFDPISQEHYYSLQTVFAALDRADREFDIDPDVEKERRQIRERRDSLRDQQSTLLKQVKERAGEAYSKIEKKLTKIADHEDDSLLSEFVSGDVRGELVGIQREIASANKELANLPPVQKVYCGTIHHGSGAFKGTGSTGGKPRTIHVLHRGDILQPRQLANPGRIPLSSDDVWNFDLQNHHPEGARRVALAEWIADTNNPLTWRSIVNRVWHYHFGQGIVDSPNDFGRMGALPSHPGLLDWLAVEFRDNGQSIKELHKLVVCSAVYRQQSTHHTENAAIDSGNRFLWRMKRRRLSAEEVRDAVLAVSGKLNRQMYGPGVRLFELERTEHSPHYEYHKHEPNDPASHRRSVYRFIVRSQPDPFMTTLDCADSSQSVAKRIETVTALQALSLMNNKFMLAMAEHFSDRVKGGAAEHEKQVSDAFQLAFGRSPNPEQANSLDEYASEFGLANACRLLFNLNEFVFVD